MKPIASSVIILAVAFAGAAAYAQNWTTVSASNITDLNQNKLAAGQLCFLATDQNDNPVSFNVGGGGQVLKRGFCSSVTAGAVAAFTVPNPANTSPAGVYYRVTAKDTSTGAEVLRYTQVAFSGGTFSFDNYAPNLPGAVLNPLAGNAVTGNLSVSGNANITGSLTVGSFNPTVVTSGQWISNTASPAGSGILRLASGDAIDWRNNANSANVPLQKTGAAAGGVPADTLDVSGFGGLKLPSPVISAETAAPAGVGGADVLYADSATHRWKMINNNASADSLLGAATADTLTNKTLIAAASGNAVTLLNEQGPAAQLTGNAADQTIYSFTLPGNTMQAGKGIRIRVWSQHSSGSAAVTYKIFWGSAICMGPAITEASGNSDVFEVVVFNNPGVANAQHCSNFILFQAPGVFTNTGATAAVDTTAPVVIKFTFNAAATEKVTGGEFMVELIQ